eukprot:1316915-Amorphochlora_amoeboformis.AAC.2
MMRNAGVCEVFKAKQPPNKLPSLLHVDKDFRHISSVCGVHNLAVQGHNTYEGRVPKDLSHAAKVLLAELALDVLGWTTTDHDNFQVVPVAKTGDFPSPGVWSLWNENTYLRRPREAYQIVYENNSSHLESRGAQLLGLRRDARTAV